MRREERTVSMMTMSWSQHLHHFNSNVISFDHCCILVARKRFERARGGGVEHVLTVRLRHLGETDVRTYKQRSHRIARVSSILWFKILNSS